MYRVMITHFAQTILGGIKSFLTYTYSFGQCYIIKIVPIQLCCNDEIHSVHEEITI